VIEQFVLPNPQLRGLYHLSAEPISKHDLLVLIRDTYGKQIDIIPDDSLVIDRSLNSSRFRETTGFEPKSWPNMIQAMHDFG
jgi:dTDP-4-dehydrorhamnose reductase